MRRSSGPSSLFWTSAAGGVRRWWADAHDLAGDLGRRQHEIDAAGGDGAGGHAVVLGRSILREGDAALAFDGLEASVPSEAVPESTTAIAWCRRSVASERKN
jgi:hypothetical protein